MTVKTEAIQAYFTARKQQELTLNRLEYSLTSPQPFYIKRERSFSSKCRVCSWHSVDPEVELNESNVELYNSKDVLKRKLYLSLSYTKLSN